MIINRYYYAPHHHCLRTCHLEADLDQMVELGCDALSICVHHHDLTLWFQQRLQNVIDLAHQRGLKVHAVPNFWYGIVAGWIPGICGPHWEEDEPRPANDAVHVARFLEEMSGFALEQNPDPIISLFCESSMLEFIDNPHGGDVGCHSHTKCPSPKPTD